MSLVPATPQAMQLLMEGAVAMARIEQAGLRVDVPYLDKAIKDTKVEIANMEESIRNSKEYKAWMRHYGDKMKLNAPHQLGYIIFDVMGHKRNPFMVVRDRETGKVRPSNEVAAFEHLRLPFVNMLFDIKRLKNALVKNLQGIRNETIDGRLHPFFHLHTTESYRPSSSNPNLQNQPVRNEKISQMVRSAIIPSKDCDFIEADYGTQEVRVSYCYNKDSNLLHDILNGDMHRDRAKDLYILTDEEMGPNNQKPGKTIRYVAKNRFVFAEFYGSYYMQCAPDLWDAISLMDLKTTKGISLFYHLKSKGIKKLGACDPECFEPEKNSFEKHVKEVERKMWEESYPTYNEWKKKWWALYQRQGGVNTLTGFKQEGVFRRNQILCDPIQGSAFHCLLWSCIQIQKEFIRYKMKSKVVNQIHDSMLIDCYRKERKQVIEILRRVMVDDVAKHWKWIICPLSVEFEICERNWFQKSPYKETA